MIQAGRTDLFYSPDISGLQIGDFCMVEADRGRDIGRIVNDKITVNEALLFQQQQAEAAAKARLIESLNQAPPVPSNSKEIMPKRIYGRATQSDIL